MLRIFKNIFSIILVVSAAAFLHAQQPDTVFLQMMPDIPASITSPDLRADYLAMHYWDKFNFRDTAQMFRDNFMERFLVEFFDILNIATPEKRTEATIKLLRKAEPEPRVFRELLTLSEKYLYNFDSPVADEEKLIPVLQYALQSGKLDENARLRPQLLLANLNKNRVAERANNFTFTLLNGDTASLYSIKSDYTLLFFKNPDCEDCQAAAKQIAAMPTLSGFISQGRLKVLTFYPFDDVATWRKHAPETPSSWLYSRDADGAVMANGIYDIKHFPLLYLLDADKRVLLKDTRPEIIENYLKLF